MKKYAAIVASLLLFAGMAFAQAPADTYVFQTFGEPVTLDPARGYDTGSGAIIENVYETFYQYAPTSEVGELIPGLATDYTVSDDLLTWTFYLRDGVKFHSGNDMTCKDVAWSFKYGATTANSEGAPAYLMGNLWLGTDVEGDDKDAYLSEVTWDMVDNIVTCPEGPEGLVAQVNLVNPTAALLPILTYTAFSIVDSEWAAANGQWDGTEATWEDWIGRDLTAEYMHTHMSGTGAYKLVAWNDDSVIAERHDDYWGGAPAIKNVVYQYVDEASSRILAIQQGDADRIGGLQRAQLSQLAGAPGVSIVEDDWYPTSVTAAFFNFDINTEANEDVGSGQLDGNGIPSDFFADVNVRLAFAHLLDHQQFIDEVYQGKGGVLTMGLPAAFNGYNADAPFRDIDLEAAESYFRDAFGGELWEKGFEFTALYNAGNTIRQTALEIIADNLEFINPKFHMNVRDLPWADYLARTAEKKAPMFALGWAADYADAENFINTFYDTNGYYAARTSIYVEGMQKIIDEANTQADPDVRGLLYRGIGSVHYATEPLLVLPVQEDFMVVRDSLQGYYYNSMLSTEFYWKYISK